MFYNSKTKVYLLADWERLSLLEALSSSLEAEE
jgi:hypothetical protein